MEFEKVLKVVGDGYFERKARRLVGKETGKCSDQPRMNERIREGIKRRKELNRLKRRAEGMERERLWIEYKQQKERVKQWVREAKSTHERQVVEEVKREKNSRKMWEMINKLKGDGKNSGIV